MMVQHHNTDFDSSDVPVNQSAGLLQALLRGVGHREHDHQDPHQPPSGGDPSGPSTVEFRSIDGSGNNVTNGQLNAAGADFTRIGPAHFADGISAPVDGPNPRMISNVVVGQGDANVANR